MSQAVASIITHGRREFSVAFDDTNDNGQIDTASERTAVVAAINVEISAHRAGSGTNDTTNITAENINWGRTQVVRTPMMPGVFDAGRIQTVARFIRGEVPAEQTPSITPTETPSASSTTIPASDVPPPLGLDKQAVDHILGLNTTEHTPAHDFLRLIAESKAICSETTQGIVVTDANNTSRVLTRTQSMDALFNTLPASLNPHLERFRADPNAEIPFILNGPNHGLTPEHRTQLIRWLERSAVRSGDSFITNGTRYQSALATEFSDIFICISQAHRQLANMGTERMTPSQKIDLMAQIIAARLNNIEMNRLNTLTPDQVSKARNYLLAYFGIVNVYRQLAGLAGSGSTNVLPTLEAAPARRPSSGGGHRTGGAGASSSNDMSF